MSPWEISCHWMENFGCRIMVPIWQSKKGLDPLTMTKIKTYHLTMIKLYQHYQIAIDFGCRNLMVIEKVSIAII
jgi:hypothetical protein